jgi:hypothetical protein
MISCGCAAFDDLPCWTCCEADPTYCECSAQGQCAFCDLRPSFPITKEDAAQATKAEKALVAEMDAEFHKWVAEEVVRASQWGGSHETTLFFGAQVPSHLCRCIKCLLSPDAMETSRQMIWERFCILRNAREVMETGQWYSAWLKDDPEHNDPSKWGHSAAFKLLWNLRRTSAT